MPFAVERVTHADLVLDRWLARVKVVAAAEAWADRNHLVLVKDSAAVAYTEANA